MANTWVKQKQKQKQRRKNDDDDDDDGRGRKSNDKVKKLKDYLQNRHVFNKRNVLLSYKIIKNSRNNPNIDIIDRSFYCTVTNYTYHYLNTSQIEYNFFYINASVFY